jgi:hypothetical protein
LVDDVDGLVGVFFFVVGVVFLAGAFFLDAGFFATVALAGVRVEIVCGIVAPSGYRRR